MKRKRSISYYKTHTIGGDAPLPLFEGRWRAFWWSPKKGMRNEIGELL
jgi:hypothetical protein